MNYLKRYLTMAVVLLGLYFLISKLTNAPFSAGYVILLCLIPAVIIFSENRNK